MSEWCSGVLRCLESYGTLLLDRPWMIQSLDLKPFTKSQKTITSSQGRYEAGTEREYTFSQALTSTTQEHNISGCSKLGHNQWSLMKVRLGFFVYDPTQTVFFSGELGTDRAEECLFVQQVATGKRLAPTKAGLNPIPMDQEHLHGVVITAKVSRDGKYLAIAYDEWLSVWTFGPSLAFSRRIRNRGWAFRYIIDKYHTTISNGNSEMIAFEGSNKLFVPGGWYDLHSKEFCYLQDTELPDLPIAVHSYCFSGDAKYVFSEYMIDSLKRVTRKLAIAYAEGTSVVHSFDVGSESVIKPGNTGDYVILFDYIERRRRPWESAESLILMNVASTKKFDIQGGLQSFGPSSVHFDPEDKQLITFLLGARVSGTRHADLVVSVWDIDQSGPKLCSQGQILIAIAMDPATNFNPPLITMGAEGVAWVVTCDRILQEVRFSSSEVLFPGYVPIVDDRTSQHSQLSRDARYMAIVQVLFNRVQLQILELSSDRTKEVLLHTHISLSKSDIGSSEVPVALSPNLDLLVVGSLVFLINLSSKSCDPTPVRLDINPHIAARDGNWHCAISSCGRFISFDKLVHEFDADGYHPQPGHTTVFRLDRAERTLLRLNVPSPADIHMGSPSFHPSLPLAAFSYLHCEGRDYNQSFGVREPLVAAHQLSLNMIDLEGNITSQIAGLELDCEVQSKLQFSDCGTFTYFTGRDGREGWPRRRILLSEVSCFPSPFTVLSTRQHTHSARDRC